MTQAQPDFFEEHQDSSGFEVIIVPDFFLLGTFSDYLGIFHFKDKETQLDKYFPYEEGVARYVNNFIFEKYLNKAHLKFEKSGHSVLYLPALAQKLHSEYFDEKGNFIDDKLDTEEKKYSFLLGAYLRYGKHIEDNIYKIQIVNSLKDKLLYGILKDLESDKIVYKYLRGYLPSSDIFYFEAAPRMIKYFKTVEKENQELRKKRQQHYDFIFKSKKGKELQKKFDAQEEELIKSLQLIFQ